MLANTCQAVVFDLGESKDIHPRNKQEAANRLVRHALAKDYGYKMAADSPIFDSVTFSGNKAVITFKNVSSTLYAFDTNIIKGFTVSGNNQKFVNAKAKILNKNQIEVSTDSIEQPVAVRYGWENNPIVNLYDRVGLPVTPFRTDNWQLLSEKRK
jgi:sialate O-acetylesterase